MTDHGDDIFRYDNIRLNFSSNIYSHFDHTGLHAHLNSRMACISAYPEPDAASLELAMAEHLGIDRSQILVTNGATEAIYLIAQLFHGQTSCIPQPTFSEYSEACRINGHKIITNPADGTQQIFWLCNPNNPTGKTMPLSAEEFDTNYFYIIDQSYARYTESQLLSVQEALSYPNVLLLHSMTKDYGIPGIRLGYVTAQSDIIRRLRDIRMPWSVNALAIEAGKYLLEHDKDYRIPLQMLLAERQRVSSLLQTIGISTTESDTPFMLCEHPSITASVLKDILAKNHGILIRDASNFPTLSPFTFRISVQHPEENNQLARALNYEL